LGGDKAAPQKARYPWRQPLDRLSVACEPQEEEGAGVAQQRAFGAVAVAAANCQSAGRVRAPLRSVHIHHILFLLINS
jgi:hypothetical protein